MFSKAFQFTMRYGHTHWRDLWLVVLGTPPAPLLPFHFWSRSRFTCSKKITCDRISSSKKKKRITMFHFSSIRNLSYLKYIFMMYLNKHTIIKENGDQVIKSMLTVHSVLFCSDVNLWDCKSFNYNLTNSHTIHFLWICFVAIHIPSPQFSNFIFEVSVCMTSLIIQKPTIK